MDKLNMQTANIADENFKKLAELFPNAVTETINENGEIVRAIDKDVLMQEINTSVVEGREERYQFTWPDKRKAIIAANAPTTNTLRPCRDDSVNFDTTENLYIEGDNLEVLKLLQENYLGQVKMIYIDPPYNTGNDFVYEDDFAESTAEYLANSGQYDEDGNRLTANTESNGRFHTDWLNMIYPRLKVARNLLSEDGVIFISMGDEEQKNLKNICDEIFGSSNFLAQVVWERAYSPINLMKHFSPSHDYILCYAKNKEIAVCNGIPRSDEANNRYSNPDNDPRGVWKSSDLSVGPAIQKNIYPITTPSGRVVYPPSGYSWRVSEQEFEQRVKDNRIWFGPDGNSVPSIKRFLNELRKSGITPMTIWKYAEVDHSQAATQKLAQLFDGHKYFDYPKPVALVRRCIELYSNPDSIILDFFSGSATTAHAVIQLNAEDGGNRQFIMVQLPEPTDESSEAYKAGYKNICEIGKERIRRAAKKIKDENPDAQFDGGFRVLKLDTSNMQQVYYTPETVVAQSLWDTTVDNIKEGRTSEDLLFQAMLELNVPLSSPIKKETIDGKEVFNVADGYILACFDNNLTDEIIADIAKRKPYFFVMRDSSMADDSVAVNFEQLFKSYSPQTILKVF